jgi:hypothetical protein
MSLLKKKFLILVSFSFICAFSTAMENQSINPEEGVACLHATSIKEIFLNIFKRAKDPMTIRAINRCCKPWNRIMNDSEIFRIFFPYHRSIVFVRSNEDFDSLFESPKPYNSIGFYIQFPLDKLLEQKNYLKRLEICSDFILSPSILSNITNLQILTLSGNNFEDPKELAGNCHLPMLKKLTINQNNLSSREAGKWIKSLTNLEWLDIEFNQLRPYGGKCVGSLTKLKYLNIQGNDLMDEGILALTSLVNLTNLNVRFNFFDSAILKNFTHLTNLKRIYIPAKEGKTKSIKRLKKRIPTLQVYDQT